MSEQVIASSEEIVTNRCGEQVVTSSKEIVTVTYRVVATSKSLRVLKKSLRLNLDSINGTGCNADILIIELSRANSTFGRTSQDQIAPYCLTLVIFVILDNQLDGQIKYQE
ncbi:hypothetical protein Taro_007548 [Colocasia esculenta]|uniref:Uncharacterized protein n=1 Tax=Colocasia esculenta TaxID=4460 RepID=A0A843TUF2_COLES|nr:hypothetical protein [Colocasia esculenta]